MRRWDGEWIFTESRFGECPLIRRFLLICWSKLFQVVALAETSPCGEFAGSFSKINNAGIRRQNSEWTAVTSVPMNRMSTESECNSSRRWRWLTDGASGRDGGLARVDVRGERDSWREEEDKWSLGNWTKIAGEEVINRGLSYSGWFLEIKQGVWLDTLKWDLNLSSRQWRVKFIIHNAPRLCYSSHEHKQQ